MTTAPLIPPIVSIPRSRGKYRGNTMKNPAKTHQHGAPVQRQWVCNMLWAAFPSASENILSEKAARALDCSERQVRNWLRCEHDAGAKIIAGLVVLIGFEAAASCFYGKQSRRNAA